MCRMTKAQLQLVEDFKAGEEEEEDELEEAEAR